MSNWIGLLFFVTLVVGVVCALSFLGKPRRPLTEQEFERRVSDGPGLVGAGLIGLQKALEPAAERAEVTQQEFKRGNLDKKQQSGDNNDTEPDRDDRTQNEV